MRINDIRVEGNVRHDLGNLSALVESIKEYGILEPLVVTPDGRLLAGHRRLAAAQLAGLESVPVRVLCVHDERVLLELGLIENVQREDLDPLSRAHAYRALIEQYGATVEKVANLVGQGVGHVYQHLQLLSLHPQVQEALRARVISFADARALAPLEHADQVAVLQEIQSSPRPLSSRQVRRVVEQRRVMRRVRQNGSNDSNEGIDGNYAALYESNDVPPSLTHSADPLDELNALIAEMVEAAQGEDRIRGWARRLSRILEALVASKRSCTVQDRLL